ncbi:MAG: hypothetical protein ACLFPE_07225 [Bacteroidales bacterium]
MEKEAKGGRRRDVTHDKHKAQKAKSKTNSAIGIPIGKNPNINSKPLEVCGFAALREITKERLGDMRQVDNEANCGGCGCPPRCAPAKRVMMLMEIV